MTADDDNLDATLTIRMTQAERDALDTQAADERKRNADSGARVTATSLARGFVRKGLDAAKMRGGER